MRRTTFTGLLLGGFLLAACQNSSGGAPSNGTHPGPTAPLPSGNLTVFDPSGAAGPFQIQELEKLVVAFNASNLRPGPHELRVAITSPSGALYGQFPAKVLVGKDGTAHASTDLQVRGSTIESYNQTGSWQLVASVDGAPLSVAAIDLIE